MQRLYGGMNTQFHRYYSVIAAKKMTDERVEIAGQARNDCPMKGLAPKGSGQTRNPFEQQCHYALSVIAGLTRNPIDIIPSLRANFTSLRPPFGVKN